MSMQLKMAKAQAGRSIYGNMGDPGLGGFLKKAAGGLINIASSVIPGGGIIKTAGGAILGGVIGGVATKVATSPAQIPMPGGAAPPIQIGPLGVNLPGMGPPGVGVSIGGQHFGMTPANGGPMAVPKGYRLNKTGYWVKDTRALGFGGALRVEPGTKLVKIRRRNPLNPRAADRAIQRITSAKRAVQKLSAISIRKKCK